MGQIVADVYAATAPNGSVLARLSTENTIQLGFRKPEAGFSMRDLIIQIHSDHALATSAIFAKHNLVKMVWVADDLSETPLPDCGFFMEEGDFAALSQDEQGGRVLTFIGPNTEYYLTRARLREEPFSEVPEAGTTRGSFDVDGMWTWTNIYAGQVMVRTMEEGFYQPGPSDTSADSPFADATWDFDRVNDSNGNPWSTSLSGAFDYRWGTSVHEVKSSLQRGGLHWRSGADLDFHAYDTDPAVDRSSATFAADKVRFAKGQNIANAIKRKIQGSNELSAVLVTGSENATAYVTGGSSSVTRIGHVDGGVTSDTAVLQSIGQTVLDQADVESDAAFPLTHIVADDELNGRYVPFIHYKPGDIVTVHTGTDDHDFNEFAIAVAAIRVTHDDVGNWFASPELGVDSIASESKAFEERVNRIIHQPGGHSHPPNPPLCPYDAGQIAMDSTWKVLNTKGVTPPDGWNEVGFDDSAWGAAAILTGGSYVMDMGHESTDAQTPSDEILLRKEFYIEPEDVAGAAVAFRYAIDNAGVIYVNGTAIVTLGPDFTNTAGHYTGNHATTLARSTFRAGYNCVAIYVNNDAAGSLGAVPPGATSAGIEVEIDTTNGNGTSVYAARCDKHYHASDIDENNYGNVQAAIDALIAGDIGATDDATEGGRALHGRFVATYHRGSDQATYVLYSEDGLTWRNGAQINSFGRDPSLIHWDGTYWALITGGTDSFFLFTSPDLDTWTNEGEVLVDASATNCWAPEWIRNMDGTPYLHPSTGLPCFTVNVSTDSETTFTIREMHPTNRGMTAWSSPVTITGTSLPTKMIDGFLLVDDDDYWLWYKNEGTNKRIELATSSAALTSGYTVLESGDWAGWYANRNGSANSIEGPCLVRLPDRRWRIYFNENNGLTSIRAVYSETTDDWRTGTSTWTTQQPITTDALMAHGTVIYIPGMYDHQRDEGAHAVIVAALETQIAAIDPSVSVADVRDVGGHWEMLMQDGVSSPPVPLTTEDGTDWLYGWVSD